MARPEQSDETFTTSRKRKPQDFESEEQPSRKRKQKFSYLKEQTRHISQELIRSEWKSLPKPARQQVHEILLVAKRTTLNQVLDGPRRREAEFVVNDVLRRLEKQLPRMPFPPNTKAAQLDLDGILEQVRMLEAEKTPVNDSVKLLQDEVEREEQRIELKRKELAKLQKETKAATKARKQRKDKTHLHLEGVSTQKALSDNADSINLVATSHPANIFDEPDEDLIPLLSQLRNHLDSIKANTQQMAEVDEEILRTKAVLTAVLPQEIT